MEKRILLVGGGSGGHAYPLIAVVRELRKKAMQENVNLRLMLLGEGKFIKRAAIENEIPYKIITAGKLRRYLSSEIVIDLVKFPISFVQSFWHLFWFMPDVVFSKGGYDSVAPVLIAKLFFIPVFIHESDSVPGLANALLGRIADKVFISFKTAEKFFDTKKVIFSGNPVRTGLMAGSKEEAFSFFGFDGSRKTILVLGGSQGAKVINDVILTSLIRLTERFNVIHQCGENNSKAVADGLGVILKEGTDKYSEPVRKYYRYYGFLSEKELTLAYAAADIVISRAGSGALFEIALLGKPAVIIPIAQSAANHQYLNAFEFSLSGGALIEEKNLLRESLLHEIDRFINPENYAKVSMNIKSFATPDAAVKIAEELLR